MAPGLENFLTVIPGERTQSLNSMYTCLPGFYHQNDYDLFSATQQGSFYNPRVDNALVNSIRMQIQKLTFSYIKQRLGHRLWKDDDITTLVMFLDGKLLEEATSWENYMNDSTLLPRLDLMISRLTHVPSALPILNYSTSLMESSTVTSLPEVDNTLSTRISNMVPGLCDAENLSNVNGRSLQCANGAVIAGKLPDQVQPLQRFIGAQYEHCNVQSPENFTFLSGWSPNLRTHVYSGERTFSNEEALLIDTHVSMSNKEPTQACLLQNFSHHLVPASSSDGSLGNLCSSYELASAASCFRGDASFSASENCCFRENQEHPQAKTVSALHTAQPDDPHELSLTTTELFYHIGLQLPQKSAAGNRHLMESNLNSANETQAINQQAQNEEDILNPSFKDMQIRARSLPCEFPKLCDKPFDGSKSLPSWKDLQPKCQQNQMQSLPCPQLKSCVRQSSDSFTTLPLAKDMQHKCQQIPTQSLSYTQSKPRVKQPSDSSKPLSLSKDVKTRCQQLVMQNLSCTQSKSQIQLPSDSCKGSLSSYSPYNTRLFRNPEKLCENYFDRVGPTVNSSAIDASTLNGQERLPKRPKLDPAWVSNYKCCDNSTVHHAMNSESLPSLESQDINGGRKSLVSSKEVPELKVEHYSSSSQGSSETFSQVKSELLGVSGKVFPDGLLASSTDNIGQCCEEHNQALLRDKDFETDFRQNEDREESNLVHFKDNEAKTDFRQTEVSVVKKPKFKGVSLIEWFTADQVRQHLNGFRHLHHEVITKNGNSQNLQDTLDENICQICGLSNLSFDPPTMYCSACLNHIGRSRAYYVATSSEALASAGQNYFCNTCYKGSHGDMIQYGKFSIKKAMLEKKKNDDRDPEPWVQCDKCSAWQHQICALFNHKKNEGERADYICPSCYLNEIELGERHPLSPDSLLGAKDLPKSKLSEHIESHLFASLRQEHEARAKMFGKHPNEVPEAKDLVIRVLSSVDRNLEVHQSFFELFEDQKYPRNFLYKSKAILLFQNIEGADVFLFGMYVQEYGSKCAPPNKRHIYLSYIDSVKYFQPDIKAFSGEALRTFVYHEILMGYLDYAKKRGFVRCYIWVCPATKREDFIFNCHPEKQKMPKTVKLRGWYFVMVDKAIKKDIVVYKTNLYDEFFVSTNECKADVSASRLPYCDGDFWPGVAEKVLDNIREQEEGKEPQKKGKIGISRRALKAARPGISVQKSMDILLMNKLEESILPKKEDFILLQLQHSCSRCNQLILRGKRWVCNNCTFQFCKKCYELECELDEKDKHCGGSAERHLIQPVDINDIPEDTIDEDAEMQSEIFDSRTSFLGQCQVEHYQFDSLRHAKYSTMMILYLVHSTISPISFAMCTDCRCDIRTRQRWNCEKCPDYNLCDSCHLREGKNHRHQLISHSNVRLSKKHIRSLQHRHALMKRNLLIVLDHASVCLSSTCTYKFCHRIKIFFRHSSKCKTRPKGGCNRCKKIWFLLKSHAASCIKSVCPVPRCQDIRRARQADSLGGSTAPRV